MALTHPCYSESAHFRIFRIHLPVAPRCNIKCKYCDRKIGLNYHEMRPGVSDKIITPEAAFELVDEFYKQKTYKEGVIGFAGPGEPLYNEETIKTLELIYSKYPKAQLCLSTNGLLLDKYADQLFALGIRYITITINAIAPIIGKNIYNWINYDHEKYYGFAAAKILIEKQLSGLKKCVNLGILTKVNSVLIPQINDFHLYSISEKIKAIGAYIHNIMPLIPISQLNYIPAPDCNLLQQVRNQCEKVIPVFRLCKQCRADAYSIPGHENPNREV